MSSCGNRKKKLFAVELFWRVVVDDPDQLVYWTKFFIYGNRPQIAVKRKSQKNKRKRTWIGLDNILVKEGSDLSRPRKSLPSKSPSVCLFLKNLVWLSLGAFAKLNGKLWLLPLRARAFELQNMAEDGYSYGLNTTSSNFVNLGRTRPHQRFLPNSRG